MATKKTYTAEITCDVCKKKKIIHEGESKNFLTVSCAVREIGHRDEYGNFHEEDKQDLDRHELVSYPVVKEQQINYVN